MKIKDTLLKYASVLGLSFLAVSCVNNEPVKEQDLEAGKPSETHVDASKIEAESQKHPSKYIPENYMTRDRECTESQEDCPKRDEQKLEVM